MEKVRGSLQDKRPAIAAFAQNGGTRKCAKVHIHGQAFGSKYRHEWITLEACGGAESACDSPREETEDGIGNFAETNEKPAGELGVDP